MFILGGMMSLRDSAIICLTLPVLYFVTLAFMPESPVYLVRQNRIDEAARYAVNKKVKKTVKTNMSIEIPREKKCIT